MEKWILLLADELRKPLPGPSAQLLMAPSVHRPPVADTPLRKGAVTLLLYKQKGQICTVFIRRVEYEGVHSGQVSFPGGMEEPDDASIIQTALRETNEEIGIPAEDLIIIGQLTPLLITVSNVEVSPVVAAIKKQPQFVHDPLEVEYVIEAPLSDLMNPINIKREIITASGFDIDAPYYDISGHHIWGATAMILSEFLEVIKRSK